jgi:hypothetical protein
MLTRHNDDVSISRMNVEMGNNAPLPVPFGDDGKYQEPWKALMVFITMIIVRLVRHVTILLSTYFENEAAPMLEPSDVQACPNIEMCRRRLRDSDFRGRNVLDTVLLEDSCA